MTPKLRLLRIGERLESLEIEMRRDDEAATAGYRVQVKSVLADLATLMGELD